VRWQLEEETTSDDSDEGWQAPFETWEGPAIERVLATLMAVLFGGAAALRAQFRQAPGGAGAGHPQP
jgi:hypothetical protein